MKHSLPMNRRPLKKKQAGLSLFEALLVLVILIIVVGGAILYFGQASNTQSASASQQQLLSIVSGVRKVSQGPSFTGISAAVLVQTGNAPSNMVSGTTLVNQFGGGVTITPVNVSGGTDNAFRTDFALVPRDVCNSMINSVAASFPIIAVGSTTVKDATAATPVIPTTATIATACDNPVNTVSFTAAG